MIQKSHDDRMLWAQFDSLEMGTGWDDTDILKPQIMVESVYGDSHPGSYHLNQMVEQAVYGVYECGGKPAKYYATDICDGCAQGHDGMNVVLEMCIRDRPESGLSFGVRHQAVPALPVAYIWKGE